MSTENTASQYSTAADLDRNSTGVGAATPPRARRESALLFLRISFMLVVHCAILGSNSNLGANIILGDPEVTANICCKSRNTDTQNYSTDLR